MSSYIYLHMSSATNCQNQNTCNPTTWTTGSNDLDSFKNVCVYKNKLECYKNGIDVAMNGYRDKWMLAHGTSASNPADFNSMMATINANLTEINNLKVEVNAKVNGQLDNSSSSTLSSMNSLIDSKNKIRSNEITKETTREIQNTEQSQYNEKMLQVVAMSLGVLFLSWSIYVATNDGGSGGNGFGFGFGSGSGSFGGFFGNPFKNKIERQSTVFSRGPIGNTGRNIFGPSRPSTLFKSI